MRKYAAILLLTGFLYSLTYSADLTVAELPNGAKYIADKIVVSKTGDAPDFAVYQSAGDHAITGVSSIDRICREYGVVQVEPFYPAEIRIQILAREISKLYIFTLKDASYLKSAIYALNFDPNIKYAELYMLPEPYYIPNDPMFSLLWFLPHIQAPEAWDIIRGDTTRHSIIAIIDTGVDWDNPDITPNIWVNAAEDLNGNNILDPGDINNIDDDENGFIDDVVGWDWGSNDNDPSEDAQFHGTSVASCASPATDNALGIAGLGFSARIMCTKAVDQTGNFVAPYQCMIYAADNRAHVINCSWGTLNYSQVEQDIINAIYGAGPLIIASAAASSDTIPAYPCGYDNVMAVTTTDQDDHKAYFAGYGSWIDVCAPGVNMWVILGSGHGYITGTSFSAALTSGLAGLVWAYYPDFTNEQIETVIENGCDSLDHLNPYYAGMLGAGRINAFNCVNMTGIDNQPEMPNDYISIKAYPNPFNSACRITVAGPNIEPVEMVEIYDIAGRLVEPLELRGGEAVWDAAGRPSGIYFARVSAREYSRNIKVVFLK